MARTLSGTRPPVHRDDLAHGRAAVADARVERAHVELEPAALALVDRRDVGVEAAALVVDLDDVALRDALRRQPPGGGRTRRGNGEKARVFNRARDATARPGRPRRPPPTPAGAARRSPAGRCGRAAAWPARRRSPARARPAARRATRAPRPRGRTARRPGRSRGRSASRRSPRTRRSGWRPA